MDMELEREQTRFKDMKDMNREELVLEGIRTEALLEEDHSRPFVVMIMHYLQDLEREFDIRDEEWEV